MKEKEFEELNKKISNFDHNELINDIIPNILLLKYYLIVFLMILSIVFLIIGIYSVINMSF